MEAKKEYEPGWLWDSLVALTWLAIFVIVVGVFGAIYFGAWNLMKMNENVKAMHEIQEKNSEMLESWYVETKKIYVLLQSEDFHKGRPTYIDNGLTRKFSQHGRPFKELMKMAEEREIWLKAHEGDQSSDFQRKMEELGALALLLKNGVGNVDHRVDQENGEDDQKEARDGEDS